MLFLKDITQQAQRRVLSSQMVWTSKLLSEYQLGRTRRAILLVNACTSEKWFRPLWYFPICFTDHRIKFEGPSKSTQPTKGSAFVFLPDIDTFRAGVTNNCLLNPRRGADWWHSHPAIADFIGNFAQFGVIYFPNALALQMREVAQCVTERKAKAV